MDVQQMMLAARNGGTLGDVGGPPESEGATDDEVLQRIGAPADLSDASRNKVLHLYKELQTCIDERCVSLNMLIERTVSMHKQIQTDVKQMMAQDEEEDILVNETIRRTEQAERDLQRNPEYKNFIDKRAEPGATRAITRFDEWPLDPSLSALGDWSSLVVLTPAECQALCDHRKGKEEHGLPERLVNTLQTHMVSPADEVHVRVNGDPVHDLSLADADGGRTVLGMAATLIEAMRSTPSEAVLTNEEIHMLHGLLRVVKAQPRADSVEALIECLTRSKTLFRDHLTPAVIHSRCMFLAITPLRGMLDKMHFRAFVLGGKVRVVEQKYPDLLYGHDASRVTPEVKRAVEAFINNKVASCSSVLTDKFVADVVYSGDRVTLDWVHRLSYEAARMASWEDLCAAAASPPGTAPVTWMLKTEPAKVLREPADQSHDIQTFSFLVAERSNLRPGHSCWESKPTPATKALVKAAQNCAAADMSPADAVTAPASSDGALSNSSILACTVAVAATGFLAGYIAPRRA